MVEGVLSIRKILLQKFSDVTKDQLQQVKCALHFWRSALAPNKTYWEKTQRANLCLSATPFQLLTIKFCSYKLRSYTVYRILLFKKKKHLSNTVVVAAENTLQEISENTFESLIFSVFLRNKADQAKLTDFEKATRDGWELNAFARNDNLMWLTWFPSRAIDSLLKHDKHVCRKHFFSANILLRSENRK